MFFFRGVYRPFVAFSFVLILGAGSPGRAQPGPLNVTIINGHPAASDRVIVRLKNAPPAFLNAAAPDTARLLSRRSFSGVSGLTKLDRHAARRIPGLLADLIGQAGMRGLGQVHVARVENFANVRSVLSSLRADPDVEFAEPDYVLRGCLAPNDPRFSSQWGLNNTGQTGGTNDADIDAPEAWDLVTPDTRLIVAVVDSGIDESHPDLAGRVTLGQDYVNNDPIPNDDNGHGTHVAGIVAAGLADNTGIAGVAGGVRIFAVKVLDSALNGLTSNVIQGISDAVAAGAKVINLSLGGAPSTALRLALEDADAAGVVVVAAAGNDNTSVPDYPAGYPTVIAVGATNDRDERVVPGSWGSNYGPHLDLVAPGLSILSTLPGGVYGAWDGTSMATPHVAGVAALMFSAAPLLTPSQVRSLIETSADDQVGTLAEDTVGQDDFYGWGRVNAFAAVTAAQNAGGPPPPPPSVTLTSPVPGLTSDNTPLLEYTVGSGRVSVLVNGLEVGTRTGENLDPLADGSHVIQVESNDGGSVGSDLAVIDVDTVPPAVNVDPVFSPTTLSSQTISGALEIGADLVLTVDTTASAGPITLGVRDAWSATISGLVEGPNVITATATDRAGNVTVGSAIATIVRDSGPPAVTLVSPVSGFSNDSLPRLTYTISETATVSVTLNGVSIPQRTGDLLGPLLDGAYTLVVTAVDTVGNPSVDPQASVSFSIDATPPAVAIENFLTPTNAAAQTIGGTYEDGATLDVTVDSTASFGTVTFPAAGQWEVVISGLVEGANNVTASSTDPAGNTNTAVQEIFLDTAVPIVSPVSPRGELNDNNPVLAYTVNETATMIITLNGAVISQRAGERLGPLIDDSYTLVVTAIDDAGNASASVTSNFTVDTTAPVVTLSLPSPGLSNNPSPQLTYTISEPATVGVSLNGVSIPQRTGDFLGTLPDGDYTLDVSAQDAAGNTSLTVTSRFTVDTLAPVVMLTSPVPGPTNKNLQPLTYTVSDGTVSAIVDGTPVQHRTGDVVGPLAEGPHTVRVDSEDTAGNIGSASAAFTVDTTPPSVAVDTVTTPTSTPEQVVSGTVEIGAGINMTTDTGATADPIVPVSGTWSTTVRGLSEGFNTITVTATDPALNTTTAQTTIEVQCLAGLACVDPGGVACLERIDGGSDRNNMDAGAPRVDLDYSFQVQLTDVCGNFPVAARLFYSDRAAPQAGDFTALPVSCTGDTATGALCTKTMWLGPSPSHSYYFEVELQSGQTIRHPSSGFLSGPDIDLMNGFNMLGLPRNTVPDALDSRMAFGSPVGYRWEAVPGLYSRVDAGAPVEPGEGYFVDRSVPVLPDTDAYPDVAGPDFIIPLSAGWNLVSNPYAAPVMLEGVQVQMDAGLPLNWLDAATAGWVSNAIYFWQGDDRGGTYGFKTTDDGAELVPWLGFWIELNMTDGAYRLRVPAP